MKLLSFIPSVHRRVSALRVKIVTFLTIFLVFFLCAVFVIPIRNVIFYPFLEYAWRDIPTAKLLSIHYSLEEDPDEMFCNIVCNEYRRPKFSISDLDVSNKLTYPNLEKDERRMEVLRKQHGSFLPTLNLTQKMDTLFLYSVLVAMLDAVEVEYFVVSGTLLGLVRHGGFIPWDDDMDITISVTQRKLVQESLACVEGFTLTNFNYLHWKFLYTGSDYPFIDIFFYQMDESYVWSLTRYIRTTFIYPTKYVFPLTVGTFEGLIVPVPHDSLSIVRRIYDYDTCNAYIGHIDYRNHTLLDEYPQGFSIRRVDCRELLYLYNMSHLGEL